MSVGGDKHWSILAAEAVASGNISYGVPELADAIRTALAGFVVMERVEFLRKLNEIRSNPDARFGIELDPAAQIEAAALAPQERT